MRSDIDMTDVTQLTVQTPVAKCDMSFYRQQRVRVHQSLTNCIRI